MNFLLNFLSSKIASSAAVVLIALLIVVIGPMLGLPTFYCFLIAIGLVLGWLVFLLVKKILARRKAKALEGYLSSQAREEELLARPDLKEEVRALREKLEATIRILKRSAGGGRWRQGDALYVLPWYMLIGRPAAGKTTLLRNSGLSFPSVDPTAEDTGVKGFGGTRNCDWWFTNEGIILDTAGRYTAEGSAADEAEWGAFLSMLKKARKKAPVNGLIIAVGFDELLSKEEVEAEARALRGKIDELIEKLGIVFPVYLVFTKCDLLQGFVDFNKDFGKKEREQVWGMTFKLYEERRLPVYKEFEEEFDQLAWALALRRNALLGTDKNSIEKQGVYLFPLEFQEIKSKLTRFIDALFESSRFKQDPVVRGIYFTSGTQGEGTVIDSVIGKMSAEMGLSVRLQELLQPVGERKAYFIKELFLRIILYDRGYISPSSRSGRKARVLRLAAVGVQIILGLGLLVAFFVSFFKNQSELKETARVAKLIQTVSTDPIRGVEDLQQVLKRLEELDRREVSWSPLSLQWGLYNGQQANGEARRQFFKKLHYLLLAPSHTNFQEYLSDTTRALSDPNRYTDVFTSYQMLSEAYDPASQSNIFNILAKQIGEVWKGKVLPERWEDWEHMLSAEIGYYWKHRADEDLKNYVITPDRETVRLAKKVLEPRFGLKQYYSNRLIPQASVRLPELRVEDLVPGAQLLQGNALPGAFTKKGWEDAVSELIEKSPEEVAKDPILKANVERSGKDIRETLKQLYHDDYQEQWKNFLAGVRIKPFADLEDAGGKIGKLADKNSELFQFLKEALSKGKLEGGDFENQVASDFRTLSDLLDGTLKGTNEKQAMEIYLTKLGELSKKTQEGAESFKKGQDCGSSLKTLVNAIAGQEEDATRAVALDYLGVKEFLKKPFGAVREAAFINACRCLNEVWEEKIRKPFIQDLGSAYPFSPSEKEATVAQVDNLLGRQENGILWFEEKEIRPAREEGMHFSTEYDSLAATVKGLYAGGELGFLFTLEADAHDFKPLSGRGGVQEALFTLGKEPSFSYKMGVRFPWEFQWKAGRRARSWRCGSKTSAVTPKSTTAPGPFSASLIKPGWKTAGPSGILTVPGWVTRPTTA